MTTSLRSAVVLPRPRLLLVVLAILVPLIGAAPADAKRRVPFGFFGTVLNDSQVERIPDATLDAQMASMARNGVESVRVSFNWSGGEPSPGVYNFTQTDRIVRAAARYKLDILPIILYTPQWASSRPTARNPFLYAPRSPELYANFARALVQRYGSRGSFWATTGLKGTKITRWQVWNEPAADFFWATRPWPSSYTPVLKAAYRAIHRADRKAKVVLASLAGITNSPPWKQLRLIYRAGGRRYFDAVSVHFFSSAPSVRLTTSQTIQIAKLLRKEMRRARDRRKQIWFTELTWTAAQGKIPRNALLGFETTPRGQAKRLKAVFSRLARDRKKLGIGRVYWYNWASEYVSHFVIGGPGSLTFQYAGLNKVDGIRYTPLPLLRTYRSVAARYEGCRKRSSARC
jgi:hypothetical protein